MMMMKRISPKYKLENFNSFACTFYTHKEKKKKFITDLSHVHELQKVKKKRKRKYLLNHLSFNINGDY